MKICGVISRFICEEERGQDVAEYCLITAFVVLVCLAILWHVSGGLAGMWTSINNSLTAANAVNAPVGGLGGS
jgi:Flp pilus assembly pilin Flp